LEQIAEESMGAFRLAKVNVDDNPNLALRFSIRSIPNIKAFRDGQMVAEFVGFQPENRIREFIRNVGPSQMDLLLDKGQSQLESFLWKDAYDSFSKYLQKVSNQPAGLLGLLKASLMLGKYTQAKKVIDEFPASPEYKQMEVIRPLYEGLIKIQSNNPSYDDPLESSYQNAIHLIARGNLPAAMDGLIDILRQNKHYHNDEVRKVLIGIFEVLGNNHPLTQQYRKELSFVLF
jgi:putative thioredoxin